MSAPPHYSELHVEVCFTCGNWDIFKGICLKYPGAKVELLGVCDDYE